MRGSEAGEPRRGGAWTRRRAAEWGALGQGCRTPIRGRDPGAPALPAAPPRPRRVARLQVRV